MVRINIKNKSFIDFIGGGISANSSGAIATVRIPGAIGGKVNRTSVNGDYDILTTDFLLGVDTSASRNLRLMINALDDGKLYCIKDESGNASINNITISTEGTATIEGQSTFIIDQDWQSIWIYSDGINWFMM